MNRMLYDNSNYGLNYWKDTFHSLIPGDSSSLPVLLISLSLRKQERVAGFRKHGNPTKAYCYGQEKNSH